MWYLAVFVPAAEADAAAALSGAVWPSSPRPESNLSVPLRDVDGAAWLGGNAAVTDAEIASLQDLVAIAGVRYYRYGIDGERALGTAFPAGPTEGSSWGWSQSLEAAGLAAF